MKLKAIAAICKPYRYVTIYDTPNGEQWISNGHAAYKLGGLPRINPEELLTIFDIPKNERDKWKATIEPAPADLLCLTDDYSGEQETVIFPLQLGYAGEAICLFEVGAKIQAIREILLKPLIPFGEYTRFYLRAIDDARTAFALAVKDGLMIEALILPYNIWGKDKFAEAFKKLAYRGNAMLNAERVAEDDNE
jgi:hypothetical protein